MDPMIALFTPAKRALEDCDFVRNDGFSQKRKTSDPSPELSFAHANIFSFENTDSTKLHVRTTSG